MNQESRIRNREIRWLIEEKYDGKRTLEAEKDIEQLRRGEHVAYIIGYVEFLGCHIDLSMRPMIPRPETEFWVKEAIAELKKKHRELRIIDAFSGSSCVGVSILQHIPNAGVEFLEKDLRLLEQIKKNLAINGVDPDCARVIHSDVFSAASGFYDAILANPPYVDEDALNENEKRELSIEPREAMYAPEGGFFYVRKVLQESPKLLKPGGLLYCEIEEDQGNRAIEFRGLYREFEVRRDQYGKPRYIRAFR